MKERIKKIMEYHNMLQQDFAKSIGTSASTLSGIFTGKTQASTKIVQSIHSAFPSISISWLLFGEGAMFISPVIENEEQNPLNINMEHQSNQFQQLEETSFNKVGEKRTQEDTLMQTSLFETVPALQSAPITGVEMVKYVNQTQRAIKEIRVFYDDGTYEDFLPNHQ